jgi:hypothetical protein
MARQFRDELFRESSRLLMTATAAWPGGNQGQGEMRKERRGEGSEE